jgi:predicted acetyltransferase
VELVDPHVRFHRSFLSAVDEFVAAGEPRHAGLPVFGWGGVPGDEFPSEAIVDPDGFAAMVRVLVEARKPFAARPAGYVPWTELWMADGDQYLGRITLRHELTDALLTWGGHIGYAVRPSVRRRGHASAALSGMLEVAWRRGIDPALVTCDVDNLASRRVIERAGGTFEDVREGKRRYWVPSVPPVPPVVGS